MGRDLISSTQRLPGIAENQEAIELGIYYADRIWKNERGEPTLGKLPDKADRELMQRELRLQRIRLRPIKDAVADQDAAARAFGRLFGFYPSLRNANTVEMCASYSGYCFDLSVPAIEAAVDDFRRNKVPDQDPDFPPTLPRFQHVAQKHQQRLFEHDLWPLERTLAVKLLTPPPLSQEQRDRVQAGLKDLAAKLAMHQDEVRAEISERVSRQQGDFNRREMEQQWKASGLREPKGFPISLSLAKQLESKGKLKLRRM